MASKGTLTVRIIGDAKSFSGALGEMSSGLSGMLGPIGLVGGALAGLAVTAGTALFGIGSAFDDVNDKIRIGTGATGANLDGLMDDFRAVARDTPSSFDDISTAIADLNTRLGLTGEPLQDMARQVLNLARLTKTDLGSVIPAVSRLMQDWGVDAEDASEALDDLFVAAQATGVGIDTLAQQAVQFGSPLRQLGFGFGDVLAMFGAFEQQGVNVETVMSGLRQSIGRFARDGEDPAEALVRVIDEIKNLDGAAANALAIETFGARAGPDLAAAISEGRFELGELLGTIQGSQETIQRATDDTNSFSEAWQIFKNRVLLALEEPAARVFNGITSLMEDNVLPAVDRVTAAFESGGWDQAWIQIQKEWNKTWPMVETWLTDTVVPFMADLGAMGARAFWDGLKAINDVDLIEFDPDTWLKERFVDLGDLITGDEPEPTNLIDNINDTLTVPDPPSTRDRTDRELEQLGAGGSMVLNVYNPTSEPTEASVNRELRRIQLMAAS